MRGMRSKIARWFYPEVFEALVRAEKDRDHYLYYATSSELMLNRMLKAGTPITVVRAQNNSSALPTSFDDETLS